MPDSTPKIGQVVWRDLTVPTEQAETIRDFYRAVVGWDSTSVDMPGGYADYQMKTPEGEDVAGVCHAAGSNAALPPQWLVYVEVANLAASIREVTARGGTVLDGPRAMGPIQFAAIQDPAGASIALVQSTPPIT